MLGEWGGLEELEGLFHSELFFDSVEIFEEQQKHSIRLFTFLSTCETPGEELWIARAAVC